VAVTASRMASTPSCFRDGLIRVQTVRYTLQPAP
jgi:hypothetical protein